MLGNPFSRDASKKPAGQWAPKSILLIDDDPVTLAALEPLLQNRRPTWQIETASEGGQGLWMLQKGDFDAVVCDLTMPGIHGLAVLAKVKEIDPTIVRVAMTAYGDEQWKAERTACAAQALVLKPCTSAELIRAIEHPQNFGTPGAARFGARNMPVNEERAKPETRWDDSDVVEFT